MGQRSGSVRGGGLHVGNVCRGVGGTEIRVCGGGLHVGNVCRGVGGTEIGICGMACRKCMHACFGIRGGMTSAVYSFSN